MTKMIQMIKINSLDELKRQASKTKRFYTLIHKSSSDVSQCAFGHLEEAAKEVAGDYAIGEVDVTLVKDVHSAFQVDTAPSLLVFVEGKLNNVIKGCMDKSYYKSMLADELGIKTNIGNSDKKVKNVVVYTTPTCSWCTKIKEHLKTHQIPFREVDVASNPSMAAEMQRKSGQMGVPQTEINGQMIVGFDRPKIDRLLEIG
jgi:glutaredoxin-like YruB-family protein